MSERAQSERGLPEHGPSEHGVPEHGVPEHGVPEHGAPERGMPERGPSEHGVPERGPSERGLSERGLSERGLSPKGLARREEMLAAALRVIAEQGYPEASLRGIGRELGIEPAHILYYFGSRENLLREVVERWDAGSHRLVASDADPFEVLSRAIRHNRTIRGIVHLYLAFATEAAATEHAAHDFVRDRFVAVRTELADAVRAGQAAGTVRPELDADRTARALIALADGLQLQSLFDDSVDSAGDLDAAIADLHLPRPAGR